MNFEDMTLEQVNTRMQEIRSLVEANAEGTDFVALNDELTGLENRKSFLEDEQRKADMQAVINGAGEETTITLPEERTMPTLDEVRKSQAYIEAFAKYVKTEDDKECRALLTELVPTTGQVPVPSFIEDEIRTAWENSDILSRVRKSYVDGVLRVGFELSATGAVIHTEGAAAPSEEELTIGVVTLTPASIKKWITVADEAIDLAGEAFLRYIYDELTYQITKKIEEEIISKIDSAPAASTKTAVGVATVEAEASATTMISAMAELSSKASDIVAIMNRKTYATFKSVQYAGSFNVDIFEGATVIYNDALPAYEDAAESDTYMIVGDLRGVQANFPNGEGVTIKYDDKSLAEKDLVKIVGREYLAIEITAPKHLVKVAKPTES